MATVYSQFYPISLHRNDMFWVGWVFDREQMLRGLDFFLAIIRSGWHVKSQIRISSLSSCILYFGLKIGCGFLVMGLFFSISIVHFLVNVVSSLIQIGFFLLILVRNFEYRWQIAEAESGKIENFVIVQPNE
jgi:hypothetical protein